MLGAGVACHDGTGPVSVARIVMTPATAAMFVGQTITIGASPVDDAGVTVTGQTITWSSSDTTIATVSAGVVTARRAGAVTIAARAGLVQGVAAVTVISPVTTVRLSPDTGTVYTALPLALSVSLTDASGTPQTGRTVTWTSSDASVATVSASGVVTGLKAGTVTITASAEGKSGSATLAIRLSPARVVVSPATRELNPTSAGAATVFSARVEDAAGAAIPGAVVTWRSSDTTRVTINADGVASIVARGPVTITATSGGVSGSATVTNGPLAARIDVFTASYVNTNNFYSLPSYPGDPDHYAVFAGQNDRRFSPDVFDETGRQVSRRPFLTTSGTGASVIPDPKGFNVFRVALTGDTGTTVATLFLDSAKKTLRFTVRPFVITPSPIMLYAADSVVATLTRPDGSSPCAPGAISQWNSGQGPENGHYRTHAVSGVPNAALVTGILPGSVALFGSCLERSDLPPAQAIAVITVLERPQLRSGTIQVLSPPTAGARGGFATPDATVRIVDGTGAPAPGYRVTFTASGDGRVNAPLVYTDANGYAATAWTLATTPGANTLTVMSPGLANVTINLNVP